MKRKKKTKADLWREYGLTKPSYVRYAGRKGIYWWLFSRKIRRRDFDLFGGECVDLCGKIANDWHEFQAGHFVPASKGGFDLLFDERNVHGQMPACNNPNISPMSSIGYARGLDLRYGKGTADGLMARIKNAGKGREWSQKEYDTKIRALLEKDADLVAIN